MARIIMVLIGDIRYDGRVRKEISTLVTAGHQVEIVVSDFTKNRFVENDLGIRIHFVPMTLWSQPALNLVEQIKFNRIAASILEREAPTHIHCHDLKVLLSGVWAKRSTKAKLIFDAHELMPEGMGGVRRTIWDRIEKRCISHCDDIIMPEKNRIAYFKNKYVNLGDVLLLQNFPRRRDIPEETNNLLRQRYPIEKGQKIILHTGLIAPKRHVDDLVESMTLCSDEFALVLLGIAFHGYKEALSTKIAKLGLQNRVFYHEPVPHSQILRFMASCDVGTAFYQNTNLNNFYCASNKLYEYIALNKVVLTNNYPGLLDTVEKYRQGICLAEVTAESLAGAYKLALSPGYLTPGVKKYFWESETGSFIQLYEECD